MVLVRTVTVFQVPGNCNKDISKILIKCQYRYNDFITLYDKA